MLSALSGILCIEVFYVDFSLGWKFSNASGNSLLQKSIFDVEACIPVPLWVVKAKKAMKY